MPDAALPAHGFTTDAFARVAEVFAAQLRSGADIGAGLAVYQRGQCVVDLWGGLADVERAVPWQRDTRIVVFSVTKGLAAMGLLLLADRGLLDWDAPVASVWPAFAQNGKGAITFRTLFSHRAGLAALDTSFTLEECTRPDGRERLAEALAAQRPRWEPETSQGYHAATFGMYASEVFARIAKEPLGSFLQRELFEPLRADVSLGTPAEVDSRIATLYPPSMRTRVSTVLANALRGKPNELRVALALVGPRSIARSAFLNPHPGPREMRAYNDVPARRAELAWASATGSAQGLARAYLPFASGGRFEGRRYLKPETIAPVYQRQGWSSRDRVLQKPLGWSQGFLKEEPHLYSPVLESFGHPGMGGSLGWCDPVNELTIGYVRNRLGSEVRSPQALALCRAIYASEGLRPE